MKIRKAQPGNAAGYEWTSPDQEVEVDDQVGRELLAIPDGGFSEPQPDEDTDPHDETLHPGGVTYLDTDAFTSNPPGTVPVAPVVPDGSTVTDHIGSTTQELTADEDGDDAGRSSSKARRSGGRGHAGLESVTRDGEPFAKSEGTDTTTATVNADGAPFVVGDGPSVASPTNTGDEGAAAAEPERTEIDEAPPKATRKGTGRKTDDK